jgi:uncharacterized RDD family membrane protein YckC
MADTTNPYSAPKADDDAPSDRGRNGFDLVDASASVRLANLAIDYVLFMVACFALGFIVALLGAPELVGLLTWPVMIGYYLFFEGIFNSTPGKMITRTRVVTIQGGKPSFGQIFGRTLSRFVPFEAFSFLGAGATGWHDRWTGTRVVRI